MHPTERVRDVRGAGVRLDGPGDLDPLLARAAHAEHVLIGEASHGTADFYRWRAELTKRLVAELGFDFVAVEGDWPDCHEVHRCVTGAAGAVEDPIEALHGFDRWPRWMWANAEVLEFTRWLRAHNLGLPEDERVGFHGLDVYSLWESLAAIVDYLQGHQPDELPTAMAAFRCFEPYAEDPRAYAYATRLVPEGCQEEVVGLLRELRPGADTVPEARPQGRLTARFVAEQNAEVAAGAERYYREMLRGDARSWNVRDYHMADTLDRLVDQYGASTRTVVWEHNTHVGDARATDMSDAGMVNVGQLVRERHGEDRTLLVGFGSYDGTVVAAARWGDPEREVPVPPAVASSVESLLHQAVPDQDTLFVLPSAMDDAGAAESWLTDVQEHRAIGVVYNPELEHLGNYILTRLGERYDAFVHCDHTKAVTPLPRPAPAGRV